MQAVLELLLVLASFAVLALAAKQIGDYFAKYDLPLITGFLFAGILIGPYVLGLIGHEELLRLAFVDEMALAVIAFAAGAELYLPELRNRTRAILLVSLFQILAVLGLGVWVTLRLLPALPEARGLEEGAALAFAFLMAVILLARSPSSAIAVIKELSAKGPFTQLVLGTTVVSDVVVIALFAVGLELARSWIGGAPLSTLFLPVLLTDLLLSLALGYLLYFLLLRLLAARLAPFSKGLGLLLLGYGAFVLARGLEEATLHWFHQPVTPEPLLASVLAAFWIVNASPYRDEFTRLVAALSPAVFIAFFTLTGASLALDVLAATWPVALALFLARLLAFGVGSGLGALVAGEPPRVALASGLAFVTQAGVALGLAKKVADTFPGFGETFATLVVAQVVLNQVVGPPMLKQALLWVGEARRRARSRRVWVFGDDHQAIALCRRLRASGFEPELWTRDPERAEALRGQGLSVAVYEGAPSGRVEAAIFLLTDEENLALCRELVERGVWLRVARREGKLPLSAYKEAGCQVVDPTTATVHLLAQYVQSPGAVALFLGEEEGQQVRDFLVEDPALDGVPLRELRLPADVLILAIHRGNEAIVTHGYTQLRLGDRVTAMGSPESLMELERVFSD